MGSGRRGVACASPAPAALAQEACGNCRDDGTVECYDRDCSADAICAASYLFGDARPPVCRPTIALAPLWTASGGVDDLAVPAVGDIDGDGDPEVVYWSASRLVVVDGRDGSVERQATLPAGLNGAAPAIADVDGDGLGEIFVGAPQSFAPFGYVLARYEHDLGETFAFPGNGDPNYKYAGPSLADFDHDGVAEVYLLGHVFDAATGAVRVDLSGAVNISTTMNTVAVDIFPDATCPECAGLELVASHGVYAVDVATGAWTLVTAFPGAPRGTVAVVDWDGDRDLDLVVNESGFISFAGPRELAVWEPRLGTALAGPVAHEGGPAGLAAVADFDGDGELEIALQATVNGGADQVVRVFDHGLSVRHDIPLAENSEWTTVAAFDFDCDGVPELVGRGGGALAVMSGIDGSVKAQLPCLSGTNTERPIVVDVDADGDADVLTGCRDRGGPVAFEVPSSPRRVNNQFSHFNGVRLFEVGRDG